MVEYANAYSQKKWVNGRNVIKCWQKEIIREKGCVGCCYHNRPKNLEYRLTRVWREWASKNQGRSPGHTCYPVNPPCPNRYWILPILFLSKAAFIRPLCMTNICHLFILANIMETVYLYIYLPLAYIQKTICKCDINPRFRQYAFSYQVDSTAIAKTRLHLTSR